MPDLSVVIPVFNRGELLRYTLESVRRATNRLNVETIVVDDGSDPPAADAIARLGYHPARLLQQENQGLLFARLAGMHAASGQYLLFLDSDDLVSADKLREHFQLMEQTDADVSYSDSGRTTLAGGYDDLAIARDPPTAATTDAAEFFIDVQPAPHSPVFRTAYLRRAIAGAFIPPSPLYNPVAEIWFYHNLAPLPARVAKVAGPLAISGTHPGVRLTDHWERLAVASLAVMEAFVRHCPATTAAAAARQRVADKAFRGWRGLPRGFSPRFAGRELAVWRRLGAGDCRRLGGGGFQLLARLFGPVAAARLMRSLRNGDYRSCRTLSDEEFAALLAAVPPP